MVKKIYIKKYFTKKIKHLLLLTYVSKRDAPNNQYSLILPNIQFGQISNQTKYLKSFRKYFLKYLHNIFFKCELIKLYRIIMKYNNF